MVLTVSRCKNNKNVAHNQHFFKKKLFRSNKNRGQDGHGQNGHFRFRNAVICSLYINIYIYIIVADLTVCFRFWQMTKWPSWPRLCEKNGKILSFIREPQRHCCTFASDSRVNLMRASAALGIASAHALLSFARALQWKLKTLHVDSTKTTRELCKVYT